MQCAKLKIKFISRSSSVCFFKRTCNHQAAVASLETSKYPKILDVSPKGLLRNKRQEFYDQLMALPTVEQKLFALTEYKSRFTRTYLVCSCPNSYSGTPFHRYITRTHVIDGLPEKLNTMNVDDEYESLKPQLIRSVLKHHGDFWKLPEPEKPSEFVPDFEVGSKLVNELISHIIAKVAWKNTHLLRAACDPRSYHCSFWWHGMFGKDDDKDDRQNLNFQFNDHPYYTIRIDQLLPPILPMDDPLCATGEVADYHYHPTNFGIGYKAHYAACIPGFWPGNPCEFPLLQVYTLDRLEKLTNFIDHYTSKPIEDSFAVMASFGWLNGLAMFQGFTPFHDLTYPIVGQTILTNGQDWMFSVYQLNTIAFHNDVDKKNRRNLCWCSPRIRLFETIEKGELKGLNDDVLKTLIRFVVHAPHSIDQKTLKPYLGEDPRTEEEAATMRKNLRHRFFNARTLTDIDHFIPFWHHVYKRHPDAPPSPWIKLK